MSDGRVFSFRKLPYRLLEGFDLDAVLEAGERATENRGDWPWRCRLGMHDMEVFAVFEPSPPGANDDLRAIYLASARHMGDLARCRRCHRTAQRNVFG